MIACAAAALGVTVALPFPGSAATVRSAGGALSVPGVSTPQVTVPAVSTPVATTPAVTVPSVSTPTSTSASQATSSTPSPSGPVGQVVNTVTSAVNTLTGGSSSGGGSGSGGSAGGGSSPSGASGSSASGSAGSGSGSATPSSSGSPATGSPSGISRFDAVPATAGQTTGENGSRHQSAAARRAAESRRLRTLVTRLQICLSGLSPTYARLLTLRAGLGTSAPRSAARVAQLLKLTPARERMLERAAVMSLVRDAVAGCAGTAGRSLAHAPQTQMTVSQAGNGPSSPSPTGTGTPAPAGSRAGNVSAASRVRHRGHRSVVVLSPAATRTVERAGAGQGGIPAMAIVAFAVVLMGLTLIALPGLRRRLLPVGTGLGGSTRAAGAAGATGALGAAREAGAARAGHAAPRRRSRPDSPAFSVADPVIIAGARAAGKPADTETPRPAPVDTPPRIGEDATAAKPTTAKPTTAAPSTATPNPQPPAAPRPNPVVVAPPPTAPSVPTPGAGVDERSSGPGPAWAREHATQAGLVAGVIAGGLARLLGGRRHPHR